MANKKPKLAPIAPRSKAPEGRGDKQGRLSPICEGWREAAKKRQPQPTLIGQGDRRGISFQFPPSDVDDGLPRLKSGPFKGRVVFGSRREAQEIAKRMADRCETPIRYDS